MTVWGKILGSFAGFAMGGPIGAVFGAAAGHAYDKIQESVGDAPPPAWAERGSVPGAEAPSTPVGDAARQTTFSVAVVVLGAKIAKVDGIVNRKEINAFKEVFRVPPHEVRSVGRIFDAAKRDARGFEPYARQIGVLFRREPALLENLLGSLFHIARADAAIRESELAFLRRTSELFGLDAAAFERVRAMFIRGETGDPYAVLGLARGATDEEVKKTWRQLIREHHPDTLIAKGLPKTFIEVANQKMAAINAAYDQISRERGMK